MENNGYSHQIYEYSEVGEMAVAADETIWREKSLQQLLCGYKVTM